MEKMEKIEKFKNIISENSNIVFMTGAGISTASGIPDFRSQNGIYNTNKYKYPPEKMLSRNFFFTKMNEFYDFYKKEFDLRNYEPNIAHKVIAQLEENGKCRGIITQNIDGLHKKAGSKNVIEYHGTIYKNKCRNNCKINYSADYIFESKGIPRCDCRSIIKPEITLYEEMPYDYNKAINMVTMADVLIIVGTSLKVNPFATLPAYRHPDCKIVIINREPTNWDSKAELCINEDITEIFNELKDFIVK